MPTRKLVPEVSQRSGWLSWKDSTGAVVQFRTDRVAGVDGG
jgi:hypothetical protein